MNTSRIWKCPDCGTTVEVSYDWLAEHGGPICGKCDCDMELQPEAADDGRSADVERLTNKADAAGLQPEDLDNLVHDLAASVAADVNNSGLEGQLQYLVDGIGAQHTERQLDELIAQRTTTGTIICGSIPGNALSATNPLPAPWRLFTVLPYSSSMSRAMPTTPERRKFRGIANTACLIPVVRSRWSAPTATDGKQQPNPD